MCELPFATIGNTMKFGDSHLNKLRKILAQNTEHIAIEAKDSLYYSGLLSQ